MKFAIYTLSIVAMVLIGVVAALRLQPAFISSKNKQSIRYGVYEDRELVAVSDQSGNRACFVTDGDGDKLFNVPVRDCIIDTRYRDGKLRFREKTTGREGYIDRRGVVTFTGEYKPMNAPNDADRGRITMEQTPESKAMEAYEGGRQGQRPVITDDEQKDKGGLTDKELKRMAADNPFYKEANKVLSGKLQVTDAERRRVILNYCEHFRTAYTTKDIDFLRQLFSEHALIIVGNVVRVAADDGKQSPSFRIPAEAQSKVTYSIRTKKEYLKRLEKAFAANKKIDVRFSDFRIMRHPTMDGIYGVSLRQRYKSDSYADDGWLFLLWDFRDESMPRIHVRTWQPSNSISGSEEVMNISDFNLE